MGVHWHIREASPAEEAEKAAAEEAEYIALCAVSGNYRAPLRLYGEALGMELWSATRFKRLPERLKM